jgi:glycosyltransferase involved in cell wall biosynthesis
VTGYRILYHHRIRADDGQAVHVRELIGALRAQGHDVRECALVRKADAEPAAAAPEPGGQHRFWQDLRLPRVATELLEIAYSRYGARRLRAAARAWRPHFVYERHALHCRAGLLAAARLGVPLLLEVNAPMCDEMQELGLLRFPRRARRTERAVLGGAARVLPVTQVLARRLAECGAAPERVRVIGNAADPRRYATLAPAAVAAARHALGVPPDAFALGFVGFVRDWHRLDLVLEAMTAAELAPVHLVIAGEGPALLAVRARADALGLGARCHAAGRVAAADLPRCVAAFDAALIPGINGYASPLKLFDSLAAGIVTLAPDQENLRETIADGGNGLLFRPGDVGSLRERLAFLCADRARARALGAAGRASLLANDWTWAGNARRVIAAFEELAG